MNLPPTYICPRATAKPSLTGLASDPIWEAAPWITTWTDIRGLETCPTQLKAKLMWDDEFLYLAAQMAEPDLWAFQTEHDSSIWLDNAFELFLDPDGDGHNYLEWEINPIGVTLDMSMDRPYVCGGTRDDSLEIPDLELKLIADGPVNDPHSKAKGWAFGAAFPWTTLTQIGHPGTAPVVGDIHRFNLMKMFWPVQVINGAYVKDETQPEKYWCFAPTHMLDIHRPHFWGYLQFAETADSTITPDADWTTKLALCDALGLLTRPRDQITYPRSSVNLQPGQTLIDHPTGYAITAIAPSGTQYQITADGRLTNQ